MLSARYFILCLFSLVTHTFLFSQWERTIGPVGGRVNDLASNNSYVYAATTNGVYRSDNGGVAWSRMEEGLPFSFESTVIKAQGDTLMLLGNNYMADEYIIYKSVNAGDIWYRISLPDSLPYPRAIFLHDNRIIIDERFRLYSTEDDGLSWSKDLHIGQPLHKPTFMTYANQTFYALVSGRIVTTQDWGVTWDSISLPTLSQAQHLYVDDNIFILLDDSGVRRSEDNGQTWSDNDETLESTSVLKDIVELNDTLYANARYLYYSTDMGITWHLSADGQNTPIQGLTVFNNQLFACSFTKGLLLYDRQEQKYVAQNIGLDVSEVNSMTISWDHLYAGIWNKGLYKYDLTTETWDSTTLFPAYYDIPSVLWIDDSLFVVHSFGEVFRSGDQGLTWKEITPPFGGAVKIIHVGSKLYIVAPDHGYNFLSFESQDNGESWQPAMPNLPETTTGIVEHNGALYASTVRSVYKSDDGTNGQK